MKKTVLIPSFQPPSSRNLRFQSDHDRIDMLLSLNSDKQEGIEFRSLPQVTGVSNNDSCNETQPLWTRDIEPIAKVNGTIPSTVSSASSLPSSNSNPTVRPTDDYGIDLFEGDVKFNMATVQSKNGNYSYPRPSLSSASSKSNSQIDDDLNTNNNATHKKRSQPQLGSSLVADLTPFVNKGNPPIHRSIHSNTINNDYDRSNSVHAINNTSNNDMNKNPLSNLLSSKSQSQPQLQSKQANMKTNTNTAKSSQSSKPLSQSTLTSTDTNWNKSSLPFHIKSSSSPFPPLPPLRYQACYPFLSDDFNGMNTFCRNVGGSMQGMNMFLSKIRTPNSVYGVSLLWTDLSSNHTVTSMKHCTPSQNCTKWYCNCDRTVRVEQTYLNEITGAVIVFASEPDVAYFLPLLPSDDEIQQLPPASTAAATASHDKKSFQQKANTGSNSRNSNDNISIHRLDVIPLRCQTSLLQRWQALLEMLNMHHPQQAQSLSQEPSSLPNTTTHNPKNVNDGKLLPTTLMYHYQVVMLIIFAMQRRCQSNSHLSNSSLFSPLSPSSTPSTTQSNHDSMNSDSTSDTANTFIFDPRIAAYLCKNSDHFTDQDLEILSLCKLYNIAPPPQHFEESAFCPLDLSQHSGSHTNAGKAGQGGLGKVTKAVGKLFLELRCLLQIYPLLKNQLDANNIHHVLNHIEMPLARVLSEMEVNGISIALDKLNDMTASVKHQIKQIEQDVSKLLTQSSSSSSSLMSSFVDATPSINLASSDQVASLLYETLKLPSSSSAQQGKRHISTSEDDLLKIRHLHPVVDYILKFRSLSKFLTTYLDGLRPFIVVTSLIQPSLHPLAIITQLQLQQTKNDDDDDDRNENDTSRQMHPTNITATTTSSSTTTTSTTTPYQQIMHAAARQHSPSSSPHSRTLQQSLLRGERSSATNKSSSSSSSSSIIAKIHAVWNQTTVRTGRLSCCRPNLQSMPAYAITSTVTTNIGTASAIANSTISTPAVAVAFSGDKSADINIRQLFTASKGYTLVGADYSQIEVRILAHLANDPNLLALFRAEGGAGGDVYRNMAAVIFKKHRNDVTTEERNKAKTVCLGVIYGMGAPSMAARLGIEVSVAAHIMSMFFDKFRRVQTWIQRVKNTAREKGYVSTICGRRRYIDNIMSHSGGSHSSERAAAERQAVNSTVQGSASDVIKLAMLLMDKYIKESNIPTHHNNPHNSNAVSDLSQGKYHNMTSPPVATAVNTNTNRNHSDDDDDDAAVAAPRLLMQIHDELIFEVPLLISSSSLGVEESAVNIHDGDGDDEVAVDFELAKRRKLNSSNYSSNNNNDNPPSSIFSSAAANKKNKHHPTISVDAFIRQLKYCMEQQVPSLLHLTVPLIANVQEGENWGDMVAWQPTLSQSQPPATDGSSNSSSTSSGTSDSCNAVVYDLGDDKYDDDDDDDDQHNDHFTL